MTFAHSLSSIICLQAIRALRHPERYGPRTRIGSDGPIQSRARGLTRAILDTFPIVKFGGGSSGGEVQGGTRGNQVKDVEAQELTQWEIIDGTTMKERTTSVAQTKESNASGIPSLGVEDRPVASTSSPKRSTSCSDHDDDRGEGPSTPSPTTLMRSHGFESQCGVRVRDDLSPEAMGRETCPICIVDFEEGDDIRVLPCEGKHRFHPECVDQWLLELSSSCPICRQGVLVCQL